MDKPFAIPTNDGKKIYGTLSSSGSTKSNSCVIQTHGLTGRTNEHIMISSRNYFLKGGMDVAVYSQYDFPADARKLPDSSLEIQACDMEKVVDHFRPQYENIFVAGHSYGGTTMLFAGIKADAFCFWDASYLPADEFWKTDALPLEGTNYYTISWGSTSLIGQKMREEGLAITQEKMDALASRIETPSMVVIAGMTGVQVHRQKLYDALQCEKVLKVFPHADHNFLNGRSADNLSQATYSWFRFIADRKKGLPSQRGNPHGMRINGTQFDAMKLL